MSNDAWKNWVENFANVFGLADDNGLTMINSWKPIFEKANYSEEDLVFAIDEIAKNPPKFRSEHLKAIHEAIRLKRSYEAPPADRSNFEISCPFCGNAGYVSVPHFADLRNGQWVRPHRTMAVLCCCFLGERKRQKISIEGKYPVPLGLVKYEERNPRWNEQMKRNEQRQIKELREVNPAANAALVETMNRLRSRLGKG